MSRKSEIPFVDSSWPIVTGCSRRGSGCKNCWAARLAATRLKHHPIYASLAVYRNGRGHWIAPPRFNAERLTEPLHWRKPRRIFVAHTGDLFHKDIQPRLIHQAWDIMEACPQHTFMVFTKRWTRAGMLMNKLQRFTPPIPNVHIVFSASTQSEVDECAPILRDTPAAKRGLSLEPLLEHIQIDKHLWQRDSWLDFVIAGGENSLRKSLARPCPVGAPGALLAQCRQFGVKFWFKGWGAHLPAGQRKGLLDGQKYEEMI